MTFLIKKKREEEGLFNTSPDTENCKFGLQKSANFAVAKNVGQQTKKTQKKTLSRGSKMALEGGGPPPILLRLEIAKIAIL